HATEIDLHTVARFKLALRGERKKPISVWARTDRHVVNEFRSALQHRLRRGGCHFEFGDARPDPLGGRSRAGIDKLRRTAQKRDFLVELHRDGVAHDARGIKNAAIRQCGLELLDERETQEIKLERDAVVPAKKVAEDRNAL